jgi:hypothetical protein
VCKGAGEYEELDAIEKDKTLAFRVLDTEDRIVVYDYVNVFEYVVA